MGYLVDGPHYRQFPDNLTDEQKIPDYLGILGELTQDPAANIIKLPNISASIPQLKAAISELQDKGYDIPDYPDDPATDEERQFHTRFSRVLGSAVTRSFGKGTPIADRPMRLRNTVNAIPIG